MSSRKNNAATAANETTQNATATTEQQAQAQAAPEETRKDRRAKAKSMEEKYKLLEEDMEECFKKASKNDEILQNKINADRKRLDEIDATLKGFEIPSVDFAPIQEQIDELKKELGEVRQNMTAASLLEESIRSTNENNSKLLAMIQSQAKEIEALKKASGPSKFDQWYLITNKEAEADFEHFVGADLKINSTDVPLRGKIEDSEDLLIKAEMLTGNKKVELVRLPVWVDKEGKYVRDLTDEEKLRLAKELI
jgi:DNA repair exonuclease SbcCD ATPase subunit